MTDDKWTLDASNGELLIKTGITGRAARMGHRLTIAMNSWHGIVQWTGDEPTAVELDVDVDSLDVQRGEGGAMRLSAPEKALARSHALKSLGANQFPTITFRADDIAKTSEGYRLTGSLHIHGTTRTEAVELRVEDLGHAWRMSCDAQVRQSDFGIKPYSLFMGAIKVADDVTVSFTAHRAKD